MCSQDPELGQSGGDFSPAAVPWPPPTPWKLISGVKAPGEDQLHVYRFSESSMQFRQQQGLIVSFCKVY